MAVKGQQRSAKVKSVLALYIDNLMSQGVANIYVDMQIILVSKSALFGPMLLY